MRAEGGDTMHSSSIVFSPTTIEGGSMPVADNPGGSMDHSATSVGTKAVLGLDGLQALIAALATRGYEVFGPTVRDGAIIYDNLTGVTDLPAGWTDAQEAGRYRLERRSD